MNNRESIDVVFKVATLATLVLLGSLLSFFYGKMNETLFLVLSVTAFGGAICLAVSLIKQLRCIKVRERDERDRIWNLIASRSDSCFESLFEHESRGVRVLEILIKLNNRDVRKAYQEYLFEEHGRLVDVMRVKLTSLDDSGRASYVRIYERFVVLHKLPSWKYFFYDQMAVEEAERTNIKTGLSVATA